MIWFFTRDAAQIDVEVHRRVTDGGYTLVVTYPDGAERTEHFEDPAKLVTRTLSVQQKLIEGGWMPSSPLGGQAIVPKRSRRTRGARRYVHLARRAATHFHQTVTRRLAAAFGL